ncbi:hypothetical protein BMF94_7043 [Rhodotorula taiwanensis]|uniref:GPI mannosyltransferase 1 n=1 Tax=Rhodotorula taiwanensis TaxID=741276 RepID=A0A2S5AZW8_9BASI|nr:hypothetical protein BMF94_7043 [Rhodotorula taiwanensis]
MRLRTAIGLAALLRAGLLLWGTYQDAHSQVPYTDVDYFVFSDAAACILRPTRQFCGQAKGPIAPTWLGDPYSRATYRYTPLVALLLVPNEWAHPAFGKILFCCADLLVGVLLYRLLIGKKTAATRSTNAVAAIWLLNPIIANISTRGSSESVVGAIVVTTLSLAERDRWDAAALVFGLAVHVKIFPFMYGSSLIATLVSRARNRRTAVVSLLRFGALSFAAFMALNTICYLVFGQPFVQETFLYHLSRLDHRHNFSAYFYPFYLSSSPSAVALPASGLLQSFARHPLAAFLPQLGLSIGLGFAYGARDLSFAWLVQTFAFVTFNKVCTSQYFLWYLWLLPAALPRIAMSARRTAVVGVIWIGGQAIWLSQAYRLEMLGESVYLRVWSASIVFLFAQAVVLGQLLCAFKPDQLHRTRSSARAKRG